ncbi:MAG: hypothetical protein MSS97_04035 [Arcanobacterium sp.]|nr:hypothetical protein [Arcanobacterium sp.]
MKPRPYVATSCVPTLSLNGRWNFRLHGTADAPEIRMAGAGAVGASPRSTSSATDPGAGWETIFVPSHWVLTSPEDERPRSASYHPRHRFERGGSIYTNVAFPFPIHCARA